MDPVLGAGAPARSTMDLYGTVMRGLGMRVKNTAGRVAKGNRGGPKGMLDWCNHVINLVDFEGRRYLVDIGSRVNGTLS